MKSIVNGFFIAFSMYSGIPMPKVEWSPKNMRYSLCFFPLVGLAAGALVGAWGWLCLFSGRSLGILPFALAGPVIPVIITGGIHLDGFLDTADALHSYETRERKLEILKDPHAGAFAVIAAVCYFLLYAAGLALVRTSGQLFLIGLGFVISRALSGLSLVWFPAAKKEGTLYSFASAADRRTVRIVLATILALCFVSAVLIQPVAGACAALVSMWIWTYYYYMSARQFGGITGDLAGYFLCLCELAVVLTVGVTGIFM